MKKGKLPKQFDPVNLTNLFFDKFVTWDEVLRKIVLKYVYGCLRTPYKDHIMNFPRDVNGEGGGVFKKKGTLMNCKYTDEVCLCLGIVVVTPFIDCVKQPQ